MRTLRLVALSDDGKSLVLASGTPDSDDEERFELPIDERVRAAARGDSRRLTQIDVDNGTELPPRVIQSRIRAGETPEQVAASSGARVERIMRFAHPVLQERERVAEQACEARVRLTESTPAVALQRFMVERLRLVDADAAAVGWDSYRDDDGVWVVTGSWRAGEKSGTTRWAFDIPARTVTPFDVATRDFAEGTRLVRVVPEVPVTPPEPALPARPVGVLHDEEPPDDDDLADLVDLVDGPDDRVRDVHPASGAPGERRSIEDLLDEVADHDTVVLGRGEPGEDEDPRARIPAWEDIVFGVRRNR